KNEVISWMLGSDMLLLLLNKGHGDYNVLGRIPAKLFEYVGSGRPIMVIGPKESDVATIISETQTGTTLESYDLDSIKATVKQYYSAWKNKHPLFNPTGIEKYTFKNLTAQMSKLLDNI